MIRGIRHNKMINDTYKSGLYATAPAPFCQIARITRIVASSYLNFDLTLLLVIPATIYTLMMVK